MIKIEFPGQKNFLMSFGEDGMNIDAVPEWAQLKHSTCPGNQHHDPVKDYCRLGGEIELLVDYFSSIDSIEKGKITFYRENNLEISVTNDAQHVFYNAVWFILLHSDCFIFKHNQWLRKHYLPPTERNEMFYTLFSTFVMEELFLSPEQKPDIDKFKAQIELLQGVLTNLLARIKEGLELKSDSVSNGLIILSNLFTLLELDFDKIYSDLEKQIRKEDLLNDKM